MRCDILVDTSLCCICLDQFPKALSRHRLSLHIRKEEHTSMTDGFPYRLDIVLQCQKGMQATINNKVLSQLKEANNGKDLLLTMIVKDKDGNKRYSVEVNTADLTPKNKLYIYRKDSKTGELYMVNGKAYIPDSKGQLKLIIRSKGDFVLKNAEDAAKINEKILATVQAKKSKATIAKGKTEPFAFHEDLDMRNVKSISYETSDPRIATVNETGKIKGKKAGTATITATVTLKNGETKILTMKVTVK